MINLMIWIVYYMGNNDKLGKMYINIKIYVNNIDYSDKTNGGF